MLLIGGHYALTSVKVSSHFIILYHHSVIGIFSDHFMFYLVNESVFGKILSISLSNYRCLLSQKKKPTVKPVIEMGTQQNNGIDYDWLPKETTTHFGMCNGLASKGFIILQAFVSKKNH